MFPSGYKEDKLYSILPSDGSGDLDFARSSVGTRVNSDGFIETMPPNVMLNSQPTSTGGYQTGVVFQPTNIYGWDGIYYGDNSVNRIAYFANTNQIVGNTYTFSVFVKMTDGSIPSVGTAATDDLQLWNNGANVLGLQIVDMGNGIYRCSNTRSATSTTNNVAVQKAVGNSAKTFEVSGYQLVLGSIPKPYYPTTDRLNYPRIDYTGGGCGKLLIEPQRTNTVLSNSDYTQLWANGSVVVTPNATISPNGSNDAQKLASANTFGQHLIRQILGGHTVGAPYVYSCFAKAAELDILSLRLFQGDGPTYVNFDLTNGTHDGGANGKMIDYGNGWYRCMTYHSALSSTLYPYIYTVRGNTQGDGVSGLYVYGAMIEEGTVETSLIDTTTTNVTRTQDTSLTTSSNIAAAINSEEGVLFVDFDRLGLDYEDSWIGLYSSSDSFNNSIRIVYRKDSILAYFRNNSGYQAIMTYYGTWTMPRIKVAFKWKVNDFALWVNGVEGVTDTSGTTFNAGEIDTVNLGDYINSPNPKFNSKINALAVYDTALSDADLTELTTL